MAPVTLNQVRRLPISGMGQRGEYLAVEPHDDNDLPLGACAGLNVGVAGKASIVGLAGADPVLITLVEGWNPCPCIRVRSTGTTADEIVAVY